jgi:hypothetical protein
MIRILISFVYKFWFKSENNRYNLLGFYDQDLKMGTEMVHKTAAIFNKFTLLLDRKDFINFSSRENFISYTEQR